jgi:membrane protein DedA with SNARE-associated domain
MEVSPDALLAFIESHRGWAPLIFGLMAFGESLAVVGVLIPATTVMMACGALIQTGTLALSDLWIGGAIGGILGDTVSYAMGRWLGPRAETLGPLKRRPGLVAGAEAFFRRWGWAAVFFGRFIGPMRALVPLAAGILKMPAGQFQLNNVASAIIWIPVVVSPGAFAAWLVALARGGRVGLAIGLAAAALAAVAAVVWLTRRLRRRLGDDSRDGDHR